MSQMLSTNLDLIKWCDDQVEQGKELKICWEGGNDSGWAWFEIDEEKVSESDDDAPTERLLSLMYDTLDYGSWAGDFNAAGEAYYNSEEKAFIGIDNYSQSETEDYSCELVIKIPSHLWFDQFELEIQDEEVNINAAFNVKNGFLTPEHDAWIQNFEREFTDEVQTVIDQFLNDQGTQEYRGMWETFMFSRSEFKTEGEFNVITIDKLSIGVYETDNKDIVLQLSTSNNDY